MSRTPSRRGLLASIAALGATGAALAPAAIALRATTPPDADAHLLQLCAAFHAHQDAGEAAEDDAAMSAALARGWDVQQELCEVAPRTPAGSAAKAAVAIRLLRSVGVEPCEGDAQHFAFVTLGEVAGVPYKLPELKPLPIVTLLPDDDAGLRALCRESIASEAAFSAWLQKNPNALDEDTRWRTAVLTDMERRIAEFPAKTWAGLRAKVLAARASYPEGLTDETVAESILEDVLTLTQFEGARA